MTTADHSAIANVVRRFRLRANLSQEELAERSGLSTRAVSDIERGLRKTPRPETIRMLSNALELTELQQAELLAAARPELQERYDRSHPSSTPEPGAATHLPVPSTPLIGRPDQVEELVSYLQSGDARLVTLTGPGGVGKTRLALEAARRLSETFPGDVCFIDLSPLSDPDLVASTIARTLGVPETGQRPIRETLCVTLASRHSLLLLDNFEHVINAAPVVSELVATAPGLRILTTSREPLRLRGERIVAVPPLDLPAHDHSSDPALLAGISSVTLFLQTAQMVRPDFALTAENAAAVAEICIRLEGIPLAIELAAIHIRHFRPSDLLDHLERRLPLLTGGPRDLPARQQSVRAAIAWSYDLLTPDEQGLFRRMGVFAGGADLDAIDAISSASGSLDAQVLSDLASLVDKNLVSRRENDGSVLRFSMLELVREFALDQLHQRQEYAQVRQAHATYYRHLVTIRGPKFVDQIRGFTGHALIDAEIDNIRAAFDWYGHRGDAAGCAEIAIGVWHYFYIRCLHLEIHTWCTRTLELERASSPTLSIEQRAILLAALTATSTVFGDGETAYVHAEESVGLARGLPPASGMLFHALICLAIALRAQHRFDEAAVQADTALAEARTSGDEYAEAHALYHIGFLAYLQSNLPEAAAHLEASLALVQRLGPTETAYYATNVMAAVRVRLGHGDEASRLLIEAYELKQQGAFAAPLGNWVESVFLLAELFGQRVSAARFWGYCCSLWHSYGSPGTWPPQDVQDAVQRVRLQLGEEAFDQEYITGLATSERQAFELALEILNSRTNGNRRKA